MIDDWIGLMGGPGRRSWRLCVSACVLSVLCVCALNFEMRLLRVWGDDAPGMGIDKGGLFFKSKWQRGNRPCTRSGEKRGNQMCQVRTAAWHLASVFRVLCFLARLFLPNQKTPTRQKIKNSNRRIYSTHTPPPPRPTPSHALERVDEAPQLGEQVPAALPALLRQRRVPDVLQLVHAREAAHRLFIYMCVSVNVCASMIVGEIAV